MIELNLTRKRLLQIFLKRRFRWGKIPTVGLFTVYLRTVLRTPKKNAPKFSLLERFFWPVQRPNPYSASPSGFIYNLLQEFLQC